ncbi:MAG: transporter substrate-binding domain-containing protein [Rhodoferax sp.]
MTCFFSQRNIDLRNTIRALSLLIIIFAALTSHAQQNVTPDAALKRLLAEARVAAETPGVCAKPDIDRLVRIFCNKKIRAGVRENYPLFGVREGDTNKGYDTDVARAIAAEMQVELAFSRVTPANRIALLAEDRIDVTIATMGHNTQRDEQARFIRPHYYQSESILVGPKAVTINDWHDVVGRTICVTIGNGSNAQIGSHGARLMLFEDAGALPERLRDDTCSVAVQDDSFFALHFTNPEFAARHERKLSFAQVPWGMAVARSGSDRLATALDLMSQIFHREGVFLDLALANHIDRGFLEQQREIWNRPECNINNANEGNTNPACVLQPLDATLQPTTFAPNVTAFETWVVQKTGVALSLPMLKTAPAWDLFKSGVYNSLIMITGALAATLGFALLLGAALGSRIQALHWAARALTITMQSSPVVLTLVIAAAAAQVFFPYSPIVALGVAICALGLTNGCNAGQAIAEAIFTFRIEQSNAVSSGNGEIRLFEAAVSRSATQIVSFLINAAKGTPIASFIGTPDLLSALTDITAFSSGRATTYTLLMIFYIVIVSIVVYLCGQLRICLEKRQGRR